MPFTVTAIGTNTGATGATLVITTSAVVPAGSLIVVGVTEKSTTGVNGSIADSGSNSWNTSQSGNLAALAADGRGMVFFVFNSKSIANGGTITYTRNTSGASCAMSAIFITTTRTATNPEDTASRNSATGTTGTITVTSGTPSTGEDVFVGVLLDSGSTTAGGNATFTQATNWTNSTGFQASTGGSGGSRVNIGVRQQIGARATFAYAPTLSSTAQQWILLITSFVIVPEPAAYQEDALKQFKTLEVVGYHCV